MKAPAEAGRLYPGAAFASYLETLSLFSRNIRLYLSTAALIGFTVFGGIYTVLLNLYLLRLGHGPEFIGLVNAAGPLGLAVFCLPAGLFGQFWGSRCVMAAGLVIAFIGWGGLPLAEFIPSMWQAGWLLGSNMLGFVGLALYVVNINPFLMSNTSPQERNHVYAVQAALWPLAGFAGSLVGGFMPGLLAAGLGITTQEPAPYRYSLLFASLLLIPGVLLLFSMQEGQNGPRPEAASKARAAPVVFICFMALIVLLQVAGEGVVRSFFNVYFDAGLGVPTAQIGALFAAGQLLAVPAALTMPILAARLGLARLYLLASFGLALSLLPLALIAHWTTAGLGLMGVIVLASVTRPAISVYLMETVVPEWRPLMSGATTMAVGLSWATMAFGGGYLITSFGYPILFLTGAALTLLGALLFRAHLVRLDRKPSLSA